MLRQLSLLGFALLVAVSAIACKQGVGERCQVQSDCDNGLLCVLPLSGNAQVGGTCEQPGGNDAGTDFSANDQAAPVDANAD